MLNMSKNDNGEEDTKSLHLDWSAKQKRILTGGDRAEEFYTSERGYPFEEWELPHHHLRQGDTYSAFVGWEKALAQTNLAGTKRERDGAAIGLVVPPIVGAWKRVLFFGGWEHTSSKDERTFNLQSRNLFIDLRIPRTRNSVLPRGRQSLHDYTKDELRCYARQHIFAGFTLMDSGSKDFDLLCTRHHCIDWNYVGMPRSRPNKWYSELKTPPENKEVESWKEWAFATDHSGQHYYCEQWERLPLGDGKPIVALRKKCRDDDGNQQLRDGMIICVGDHFNYVIGRDTAMSADKLKQYSRCSSLTGLVNEALDRNDLQTAISFLSIQGGHGLISKGWLIDCAIEPWKEGTALWAPNEQRSVHGETVNNCHVSWNDDVWEVFDTTFTHVDEVSAFLNGKPA